MAELDPLSPDYNISGRDGLLDSVDDTTDIQRLIPTSPEEHQALHEVWAGLDPNDPMKDLRAGYLAVGGYDGDQSSVGETYGERADNFWTLPSADAPGGGFRGEAEHLAFDLRDFDALAIDAKADLTYLTGGEDPRVDDSGVSLEAILERTREQHYNLTAGLNLGGFSGAAADAIDAAQKQRPAAGAGTEASGNPDFALDLQMLAKIRDRLSRATEGIQMAVVNMDDPARDAVHRTSAADTDALEMSLGLSNMLLAAYYDLTVAAVKIGTGMASFTNAVTAQLENYKQSQTAIEDFMENGAL